MKRGAGFVACALLLISSTAFAQLSDADKKAAARAAFTDGTAKQDKKQWADALADFQKAEKLYDAPTHLLHIAECQAQLGQLVEASESYETLVHYNLEKGAPDAFVQAKAQGDKELTALKPRIPTLKINVKPDPGTLTNLQIKLNDKTIPAELVGIARPVNPGSYQITATATDYGTKSTTTIDLQEKDAKSVDLTLEKGAGPSATPPPVTPTTTTTTPAQQSDSSGLGDLGLLIGVRPALLLPLGNVDSDTKFKDYAGLGGGVGLDAMLRVAKQFLVGLTIEGEVLKGSNKFVVNNTSADATSKALSEYIGLDAGFVLDPNGISPLGWLHGGYRFFQRDVTLAGQTKSFSDNVNGALEIGLDAGVQIPAGPIRIVPVINFSLGETGSRSIDTSGVSGAAQTASTATSAPGLNDASNGSFFFMIGAGVGVYFSADFGKKP